jgi:hypothetical protein
MKMRATSSSLLSGLLSGLILSAFFPLVGCSKIAGWAIDKAIGDDAGLAEEALAGGGSSSGPASTTKVCDLVTDAEIEAATGRKLVTKKGTDDSTCGWSVSASGKDDDTATMGVINLQILNELEMKIIPVAGAQKDIPGLGNKAEWSGGMAPNLRVHVKNGKVMNFMFIDPGTMMKNTGVTETKIDKNNSAVNMEYPELEKQAIAIGKAAAGRY